jgi:hypothetical protein
MREAMCGNNEADAAHQLGSALSPSGYDFRASALNVVNAEM